MAKLTKQRPVSLKVATIAGAVADFRRQKHRAGIRRIIINNVCTRGPRVKKSDCKYEGEHVYGCIYANWDAA